jgi:tRNA dimethylallyltransferase
MDAELLAIMGPTASGKTAVAIELARRLDGEILSADSMQIYRGMDIGTAKPTPEEQRQVRFHGIDLVDIGQDFTVVDFQKYATKTAADIRERDKFPILCGGTGFYIRAYLEGFTIPAAPQDRETRRRLQQLPGPELHKRLQEVDPIAAERIEANDAFRIIRALEVYETTGRPMSEQQERNPIPLQTVKIVLEWDREELFHRISQRTEQMLALGWLEETRNLLSKGYSEGHISSRALGYRHLVAHINGEIALAEAAERIKLDTRRYAKRQMTWFRKEPNVCRIDAKEGVPATVNRIIALLHS